MFGNYRAEIEDAKKQFKNLLDKVDRLTEIVENNSVTIKILEDKANETQCEIIALKHHKDIEETVEN